MLCGPRSAHRDAILIGARAAQFDRSIFLNEWRALSERLGHARHLAEAIIPPAIESSSETP